MNIKDQIYIEPTDGELTNNALVDMMGPDCVYVIKKHVVGGGFADVVQISKMHLVRLIKSKPTRGFEFNVYDKAHHEDIIRPIIVAIKSEELTVIQVLRRRFDHKLIKISLPRRTSIQVEAKTPAPATPEQLEKFKAIQKKVVIRK